jgi:hypothetical protein
MAAARNSFCPRMITDELPMKYLRLYMVKTCTIARNAIIVLKDTLRNSLEP